MCSNPNDDRENSKQHFVLSSVSSISGNRTQYTHLAHAPHVDLPEMGLSGSQSSSSSYVDSFDNMPNICTLETNKPGHLSTLSLNMMFKLRTTASRSRYLRNTDRPDRHGGSLGRSIHRGEPRFKTGRCFDLAHCKDKGWNTIRLTN